MRRVLAATLVLLLTGAPVSAAACALACPMPTTASSAATAVAAVMPTDCAAMHHAAATTQDAAPPTTVDVPHHAPAMPGCCAMTDGPVDVPPASVARHAVGLSVALAPTVVVVSVDTPRVVQRDHLPPSGVPFDRARRTDILRL